MIILDINNMYDTSANALVVDGKVIVAAEEERFVRIKHMKGFPENVIQFCLDYGGIKIVDIHFLVAIRFLS